MASEGQSERAGTATAGSSMERDGSGLPGGNSFPESLEGMHTSSESCGKKQVEKWGESTVILQLV